MRMNESKATKKRSTPATPRKAPIARPGDDAIRLRAYELYLERGGQHGDPGEDWLRAELELIARAPGN